MPGFYYPIDIEVGIDRKGTKPISDDDYTAIKAGDIVKYRGSRREFLVVEAGGAAPWGKEILCGRTVGNSRPLYRIDIGKVEK